MASSFIYADFFLYFILEIWYQVFLWALFTSIFVHAIAAILAFVRLRKHKIGRWMSLVIIVMGVLCPLTGGVITSRYYLVLLSC